MDLITDIGIPTTHLCRTVGGLPRLTQQKYDGYWVSCTLQCDKNPTFTSTITYTIDDGESWVFDGVDDRIDIGNFLSKERTDAFSVSGDFESGPLNESTAGRFISKADTNDSVQRGWLVSARGNFSGLKINFALHNTQVTNNIRVETTDIHSSGKFLVTYDGSSSASGVKIYVNGDEVATTTVYDNLSATTVSTASLTLGNREDGARSFEGIAENLAVWNRVLTSVEAAQLNIADEPGDVAFAADLEGWWKVDTSDSTGAGGVIDHSSGGNDGTAQNGIGQIGLIEGRVVFPGIARFFTAGDLVQIINSSGIHPDGDVPLNLYGTYQVIGQSGGNVIDLSAPSVVNSDWTTLYNIDPVLLAEYGGAGTGDVTSTVTKVPT
jgi:hypothetical protein